MVTIKFSRFLKRVSFGLKFFRGELLTMQTKKVKITLLALFFLICSPVIFSQQRINGVVLGQPYNEPLAYASVISIKGIISVTDTSGQFSFWFPRQVKARDSVTISAIGYHSMKLSLRELIAKKEIRLEESSQELENVLVISTLKGNPLKFGYYRGWNEKSTGGEIGQVIELPRKNLVLGSVQVKINQNYDTCWLKLHIRTVGRMLPEDELLKEDIIVPATVKYGLMEFDLSERNIKLPAKAVYIGFEVLSCSSPQSDIPSFSFMGSEEGENLFRDWSGASWKSSSRYTIYIRLLLK